MGFPGVDPNLHLALCLKEIKAKINELESESKIFAKNERQSWKI